MKQNDQTKKHYLSIKLNDELFAIDVHKVLEVLQKQQVTNVPNVPDFIKGVINFRGEILPVIEARQKFNMPLREDEKKYVIIVLDLTTNDRKLMLGVIADGVKDVLEFADDEIKDVPDMGANYNLEFIHGMVQVNNRFLMILNVDRVFSSEEINMITNTDLS
ncbi:MAG: chemotaxis protein CheW [Marinilabiliaceae bacterium]|nr:chemotaxis protein CheW [Marinilabiliaceae bacterium]